MAFKGERGSKMLAFRTDSESTPRFSSSALAVLLKKFRGTWQHIFDVL